MIGLLVTLLIGLLILSIVWWVVRQMPIPAQFKWVAAAIVALIAIIFLLSLIGRFEVPL